MKKIILQKAATLVWETLGIFNDRTEIVQYLADNHHLKFTDYQQEIFITEGYETTLEEWLEENEFQIIEI